MTYGDIAAAEHQARFQDYALRWFEAPGKVPQVPDEHRFATPISVVTPYPLEAVDPADKTHIVLGWLLDKVTNPLTAMQARVLASVLLDNSSSPLRHALETSSLGSAPSPLCGFDDSTRETTFVCGLEGCNPEDAQAVEELALGVIRQVAEHGVPREALESALHQLELSEREVTGDGFPYGLRLLMTALTPALHGGDPAAALDIDPVLDSLRRETAEPEFIKNLTARLLLHNPHRVRLTMVPDLSLGARQAEAERQRLAALQAAMSAADKQRVLAQTRALRTRQQRVEDAELLPRVGLEDIAAELRIPEGRRCSVSSMLATWYARGTNGMVYQQLVVDLPAMEESWLDLLPLFCLCLTEVGSAGRDYRATQARQAAVTGGISTHCLVRGDVDDVQAIKGVMVLAGKALARNQAALTELLVETFGSARFDELPRLRELIAQRRGEHEETVTDRGHGLVITAASAGLSPAAALNHRWAGLMGLRTLKALDDALEDQAQLSRFAEQLAGIRDCIANAPRQLLLVSEAEEQQSMAETLARFWPNWPGPESAVGGLAVGVGNAVRRQGWVTSTQVNFCARVYPAVPQNHPDAPALQVLGDFLRNGYLHRTVREEGGAYGVGAHYDSDSGAFRFYSYRDPRLAETLQDFDRALSWLQLSQHRERVLEEAILSVIAAIDRPGSPAGEAIDAFIAELFGRTAGQRRAFRQGVLRVTLADLQRVGSTYLQPGRASSAVLSNLETLRGQPEMEIFTL
jgi:Zn-dependent M16 (insulinase) family peptidase